MIWQDVVCPAREVISMNMISVLKELEDFLVASPMTLLSFFLLAVVASAMSQSNHFFFLSPLLGAHSRSCVPLA